ncbi:MAG: MBL fold metallo-hydrolase [Acutalibacteraceae bacterium]
MLARGVTQVDRLILTHFDADHCNGVRQLLRRVRVKTLYVPDVSPENNLRTKILFAAAQAGAEIRFVTNDLTLSGRHAYVCTHRKRGGKQYRALRLGSGRKI